MCQAILSTQNINVHDAFDIYEIIQCGKVDATYYAGRIYDLIEAYFPQITIINKNKPNRSRQEPRQNWRSNNLEYVRKHNKKWFELHPDYRKNGATNIPSI